MQCRGIDFGAMPDERVDIVESMRDSYLICVLVGSIQSPFYRMSSLTNVLLVQLGVKSGRSGIARNRAQVCVNREEIMIGHVSKNGPTHHLQKIPIERKRQAVRRRTGTGTAWVNVIEIRAVPHDL